MHSKHYIILGIVFIFFSCETGEEFNPLDSENNPEFVPPETSITSTFDIVTTSSTIITWTGNADSMEFHYKIDSLSWSDWIPDTSVLLESLLEGEYIFQVQGRLSSGYEDDTPAEHLFTVDYFRPTTTITSPASGHTINSTSVEITWEVQEGAECRYDLNSTGFTDWATITSITYQYLDEGQHTFSVQSRFDPLIEEESPVSMNFTVDALQGPGLRVYMLKTETTVGNQIDLYIYAEEFENVMAAEFKVEYDNSIISPISLSQGDLLQESPGGALFITDIADDVIEVNLGLLDGETINGTGALLQLTFETVGSGSSAIEIISPIFQNLDGENIPVLGTLNGMVVVE